jgi:hydrogenase expression/formation protein HypC
MCLGIPGKIIEIVDAEAGVAKAEVSGVRRNVSIQLLDGDEPAVKPGDWILIHVGFALCRIDEEEAKATLALLDSVAYSDELNGFQKRDVE